ncbi:MAG: thiamine pyrophosphate-binding protein [Elusimicrobiota bacterium]|nr:thiamine pyrophosphate-binding protein [Elusimicrobiota bacterium]
MIKLSDYIIDFIVREKVRHIFEMIGGMITHLLDSAHGRKDIRCVSMHHEQAAAFAAEGYARMNGRLGVAMATSGPGALNMLTPIGSCYFDSVPCLFITGQVNTYEYKFDNPVRQIGFQETDIVSVVRPIVKYAELVRDPEDIRYCLEKAVFLAQSGRPGPVLLDLPMNVQRAKIDPKKLRSFYGSAEHKRLSAPRPVSAAAVSKIAALIKAARRPMILAGGGLRTAGATGELEALVKKTGIPVACSLLGLDAIPHDNPAFSGMIGAYGNRYSNMAVANCDLLLILGSRLDTRQTGTRPETFARGAKKVHVDIDPNELGGKLKTDLPVRADLKVFLKQLNSGLQAFKKNDLTAWYRSIEVFRKKFPEVETAESGRAINPNRFIGLLAEHSQEGDIICVDVGQHQMWTGQSFRLKKGQRLLLSGGMGSMGFALPAAIGASLACPGRRVLAICGDGGLQVNIQDLDSLPVRNLPVKVILMNNGCLGMVRQFQDIYFGGRRQSTLEGYHCPDLKRIVEAYGVPVRVARTMAQAEAALRGALAAQGPALVEVKLTPETAVEPKLVVNRPIEDMSPHMPRRRLREAMIIKPLPETNEKF